MESILRQEFIEVVPGDPPGNLRISFVHLRRVGVSNFCEALVNPGATPPLA
jgi:hypothetical protein